MLIRFSVENFLSFCEKTEFSMMAGKARQHSNHIIKTPKPSHLKVLKAGVIYGANASGKSNLVKAIAYARDRILEGTRPKQLIPYTPFRFSTTCISQPSEFIFEFSTGEKAYNYGFKLDAQSIHEEWLYEITASSEHQIFERETAADGTVSVKFGIKFDNKDDENFMRFTAKGTRPNQLFLTETMERNVSYFADVYNWFRNALVIIFPTTSQGGLPIQFMDDEDFKQRFEKMLREFDTSISGIQFELVDLDNIPVPPIFLEEIKQNFFINTNFKGYFGSLEGSDGQRYLLHKDEVGIVEAMKMMTIHHIEGEDSPVYLDIREESDGTRRLFDIIPGLMDLMDNDKVFIIDELDRSLHPHLTKNILELFLGMKNSNSQLIVTTHEASLLDLNLLRRDEIWFIEKDKAGSTSAYSLEEYAPRNDMDIRKGYLLGRYGGIPFLSTNVASEWANVHVETEI